MARKFLTLDFSFRCCTLKRQGSLALFWPMDAKTGEWVQFNLWRHLRVSLAHETSVLKQWDCKIDPFFFPSSHSLRAMIVEKGFSVQSSAIFWDTYVVILKNNALYKKTKAISLCLCLWAGKWKTEMTSQSKLDPFSCIVVHGLWVKKAPNFLTLNWYNIRKKNPGPKTFSPK